MLNLTDLENRLDKALENETKESLTKFLMDKRKMDYEKIKRNIKHYFEVTPRGAINKHLRINGLEFEDLQTWANN